MNGAVGQRIPRLTRGEAERRRNPQSLHLRGPRLPVLLRMDFSYQEAQMGTNRRSVIGNTAEFGSADVGSRPAADAHEYDRRRTGASATNEVRIHRAKRGGSVTKTNTGAKRLQLRFRIPMEHWYINPATIDVSIEALIMSVGVDMCEGAIIRAAFMQVIHAGHAT